jgi:hypothetical protein
MGATRNTFHPAIHGAAFAGFGPPGPAGRPRAARAASTQGAKRCFASALRSPMVGRSVVRELPIGQFASARLHPPTMSRRSLPVTA